jgi:RNA polymerase sigma factor (sigma-70 family)
MNDEIKYAKQVERAVLHYAVDYPEEDKEDLRQECFLAIITAGEKIKGPGGAYKTAKNTVVDWLAREKGSKKQNHRSKVFNAGKVGGPGKKTAKDDKPKIEFVSASDPGVHRRVEESGTHQFDAASWLDSQVAFEALERLPEEEKLVIKALFGIGCAPQTPSQLAKLLSKPRMWVYRRQESALQMLRKALDVEEPNQPAAPAADAPSRARRDPPGVGLSERRAA